MESFQFEGGCIIGWIEDRVKQLAAQGISVNCTVVQKYLLSEPVASTGLKGKPDLMDMDPIGMDTEGESE